MADGSSAAAACRASAAWPARHRWWRDPWSGILHRLAARVSSGCLTLVFPDGRRAVYGDQNSDLQADLILKSPAAVRALLLGGSDAFAGAYVDGLWDSADLVSLIRLGQRNEAALGATFRGLAPLRLAGWLAHRARRNTERGSRRNIAVHYDLGNAFYGMWLDPGMTYSAGLYRSIDTTLDQAQDAKMARVAALLELQPRMSVLEIGCGWGAMAAHLVRAHGARVTGITLSQEQLAWAQARDLDGAEFRLQDYRHVDGRFDRIVSIEMIEAVGEENWPRYFATLRDRLVPGGIAVIQAITIDDARFAAYRRNAEFIQRHIFPGGMLPSPGSIRMQAARAGLAVDSVEMFGSSYARTLADWRGRFDAQWPRIAALGFDGRFRRLWTFYLSYCEAGFHGGTIDVGLWRLRRA
jgi:cyclopropane-fatty-acyl-phospholipid synthase